MVVHARLESQNYEIDKIKCRVQNMFNLLAMFHTIITSSLQFITLWV